MGLHGTKARTLKRVDEVIGLILAGALMRDVLEYANSADPETGKEPWNVKRRTVEKYITLAYRRLARQSDETREQMLARHKAQRRALYARCVRTGDNANARAILKDEAELLGLYPARKVEMGGTMTLEVVEEIVEAPPRHTSNGHANGPAVPSAN